jgi:hypothetical protein
MLIAIMAMTSCTKKSSPILNLLEKPEPAGDLDHALNR